MTNPFPVPVEEFKAWKKWHEERGHQVLRCDDPRCRSRGLVCIECQDWNKVLVEHWDQDPELSAQPIKDAKFNDRTFEWSAPPTFNDDDFSMTQNYFKKE